MADPEAPLDVDDVRSRVEKTLDGFLSQQTTVLLDIGEELGPAASAISGLLAGGKRLRPTFAYCGWRGAGGEDTEGIIQAATSLELLQGCALIHDDVMDDSDTRRGQPSVHRQFEMLHRDADWHGAPQAFGVGSAILAGDLCLSWADEMLFTSPVPAEALLRAKPVFDLMRTELMSGQYLDLLEQARGGGSQERALRVARYKSAKYTVERPLHLGAALADAPPELVAAYSAYGLPLGEAFQLRDDILGVFGNPEETGKPAGDDLREGKRTVLVAVAWERASPAQASVIRRHLGDPHLGPDGVAALREVIDDTGALAHVEELVTTLTDTALDALAPVPQPAQDALRRLAVAATRRRQ
ncbi:MAG: polyprenyl synthetase family protein [Actinomycetota bacterium]|nr:polyprenyl synthetase family protein [Actinomycetota bacterium]MDH4352649.1 polyprenyl synthetase family protein [Actinomycetota bacterium]